jgi:PAS domain-containing protein
MIRAMHAEWFGDIDCATGRSQDKVALMQITSLSTDELSQLRCELEATKASLLAEQQSTQRVLADQLRCASVLTQLAIELREMLEPAVIIKQALKVLYRGMPPLEASILLINRDLTADLGMAIRGSEIVPVEPDLMAAVLADGLAAWVVQHRCDALVADITADPRWLLIAERHAEGSAVAVPIAQSEAIVGVLTIYRRTAHAFTNRDLLLMEGVAAQVGLALRTAHHYHGERRRREQALALLSMSQFLTPERSFSDLAAMLQEQSSATFDATFGLLFLMSDAGALTPTLASTQSPPQAVLRRATQAARQACERQSLVNDDGAGDPYGLAYVAQPLTQGGQRIGAFVLVRPTATAQEGFPASLWSLLSLFTPVVAAACSNMRMVTRLRGDAATLEALVSERTRQLQNSRDSLRTIVDHLPDGILLIDQDDQVLAANQAFCRAIVGCEPSELVGQSYAIVLQRLDARGDTAIAPRPGRPAATRSLRVSCRDARDQPRAFLVERFPIAEQAQQVEYWRDDPSTPGG